jgi:tetratricopeptide (TPR) repeat protein
LKSFTAMVAAFALLSGSVCFVHAQQQLSATPNPPSEVAQIVTQSQQALDQHDEKKATSLVDDGLARFPNNEDLQVQRARIHVYQKHDKQAISLLHAVLLANPNSRNARLLLAQIYGYHDNFAQSDRIYQELLAANPKDEAAELGLVHNLILEGKRAEARQQAKQALEKNPNSLELQQYSDYLAESTKSETAPQYTRRVQGTGTFFSDTSGNKSVDSSQGFVYQFNKNFSSRVRLEESSLWKTGSNKASMISGTDEARYRVNKYVAVRAGVGAVRFADTSSRTLYSGDLELYPLRNLYLSGGYGRAPVAPTFDAAQFDLLAHGWHARMDYRMKGFTLAASMVFSHYSDGNHAEREWAEAMKWFGFMDDKLSLGGGYSFRHLHFNKDLNHGYFSPGEYRSHLGAAGVRLRVGKWYRGEYMGYGGGELLKDFGNYSPAGEFLMRNDFIFGQFSLTADYSHYHLIQTTGAFRADAVSASFGYKF